MPPYLKGIAILFSAAFALIAAVLWAYAVFQKVRINPEIRAARIIEVDEAGIPQYDILETAKRQTKWNGWAALAASVSAVAQALALLS